MRCLALAQALQDRGGRARFLMSDSAEALEGRIEAEGLAALRLGCPTATEEDLKRVSGGNVNVEYKPQKADGSLDAGIHFKYDLKAQKEA